MRQIICDKCGAIIEESPWKIAIGKSSILYGGGLDEEFEKADYCDDCIEDIKEYIAKKGRKQRGKGKKLTKDQKGTIESLYKAGWEVKEIAADVGVSIASVYKVIREIEK